LLHVCAYARRVMLNELGPRRLKRWALVHGAGFLLILRFASSTKPTGGGCCKLILSVDIRHLRRILTHSLAFMFGV
jgi:hypothetical protein